MPEIKGAQVEEMFHLYEDCLTAITQSLQVMYKRRDEIIEKAEKEESGIIVP